VPDVLVTNSDLEACTAAAEGLREVRFVRERSSCRLLDKGFEILLLDTEPSADFFECAGEGSILL
jgi:hypothetical protein